MRLGVVQSFRVSGLLVDGLYRQLSLAYFNKSLKILGERFELSALRSTSCRTHFQLAYSLSRLLSTTKFFNLNLPSEGLHNLTILNSNKLSIYQGDVMRQIRFQREGDCHICISHSCGAKGYPQLKINNRPIYMSRFIYEAINGPIPYGMIVRHTCDNPQCINPDHLILGTHADNVKDRVTRKRSAIGEQNGRAKLTEEIVRTIRGPELPILNCILAQKYNVSPRCITQVKDGETWRHVQARAERDADEGEK